MNLRRPYDLNSFRDCPVQPLRHSSKEIQKSNRNEQYNGNPKKPFTLSLIFDACILILKWRRGRPETRVSGIPHQASSLVLQDLPHGKSFLPCQLKFYPTNQRSIRNQRRGRDLNPGGPLGAYTLSRRARSAAPAPLRWIPRNNTKNNTRNMMKIYISHRKILKLTTISKYQRPYTNQK